MSYTITNAGVWFHAGKSSWFADLKKTTILFWRKHRMDHKVFFDVYDRDVTQQVNTGYATIDKEWPKLKARERAKIMKVLARHFLDQYMVTIGNYRDTIKKD